MVSWSSDRLPDWRMRMRSQYCWCLGSCSSNSWNWKYHHYSVILLSIIGILWIDCVHLVKCHDSIHYPGNGSRIEQFRVMIYTFIFLTKLLSWFMFTIIEKMKKTSIQLVFKPFSIQHLFWFVNNWCFFWLGYLGIRVDCMRIAWVGVVNKIVSKVHKIKQENVFQI